MQSIWVLIVFAIISASEAGSFWNQEPLLPLCSSFPFSTCNHRRRNGLCEGSCTFDIIQPAPLTGNCENQLSDWQCQNQYSETDCFNWSDAGACDKRCSRCIGSFVFEEIAPPKQQPPIDFSSPCSDVFPSFCVNPDCSSDAWFCKKTCGQCHNFPPFTTKIPTTSGPVTKWNTWSVCSKKCGRGTQYKVPQCPSNNINTCPKTYQECNTGSCKQIQCSSGHEFRYNSTSSCCKKMTSSQTCGKVSFGSNAIRTKRRAATQLSMPAKPVIHEIVGGGPIKLQLIGGVTADSWPFMAYLKINHNGNAYTCGGVVIHRLWVLTAAHCVSFVTNPSVIEVILGTGNVANPGPNVQTFKAAQVIVHPSYTTNQHDIALIRLNKYATITKYVSPICLPQGELTPIDERCMAAGWGKTKVSSSTGSDILMEVALYNLPLNICKKTYPSNTISSSMHLCIGVLGGGYDTCNGDSGGPIYCQRCSSCSWYVAGLTSFGMIECGKKNAPAVYTHVLKYEAWIKSKVTGLGTGSFTCP